MESTATWTWLNYEFTVYHPETTWNETSGLYVFARRDPILGGWHPLYIGQTVSFAMRFQTHEKWPAALSLGATHIHAMTVPQAANRDIIENHLIRFYRPQLNEKQ